ncbi:MAG: PaaI family thioesterase [Deltaproteobacteria bacterium]|jgi:uncharacterized protein (TIGR00369 family)|nr:PaaI family thioesterase [Deltaproteobacteria bacterium]
MPKNPFPFTLEAARAVMRADHMCRELELEIAALGPEGAVCSMTVAPRHVAPNGFLHAGLLVLFADTTCGVATAANLPPDTFFATLELKSNHISTVRQGKLCCTATPRHLGGSTQVWDAEVTEEKTGKGVALFRCTQMLLKDG